MDGGGLMSQIEGHKLLLGGMISQHSCAGMRSAGITHVVSVLRASLDDSLFKDYTHHVVPVDDSEHENLFEHFGSANTFIARALTGGGVVLVHCAMGISRAATVLAAFLMHSQGHDSASALSLIRQARPNISPNRSFLEQLNLYHSMGCPSRDSLDNQPAYQQWLFQREVEIAFVANRAPVQIYFRDENKIGKLADVADHEIIAEIELRCKKCRRPLGSSRVLASHHPKRVLTSLPRALKQLCSHHFVEPLLWMKAELEQGRLQGKLACPKCRSKVGWYAWQGIKCSCGGWVVPGISIARGKVDEVKVVKSYDSQRSM